MAVQFTVAVEGEPAPARVHEALTLLGGWRVEVEYVAEADAAMEKLAWATCPVQPTTITVGTRTRLSARRERRRAGNHRGSQGGRLPLWSSAVKSLSSGLDVSYECRPSSTLL